MSEDKGGVNAVRVPYSDGVTREQVEPFVPNLRTRLRGVLERHVPMAAVVLTDTAVVFHPPDDADDDKRRDAAEAVADVLAQARAYAAARSQPRPALMAAPQGRPLVVNPAAEYEAIVREVIPPAAFREALERAFKAGPGSEAWQVMEVVTRLVLGR